MVVRGESLVWLEVGEGFLFLYIWVGFCLGFECSVDKGV